MAELNGWQRPLALGVGISGEFAHTWYGYVADPAGEAQLCSGQGAYQPTAAPTGTILNETRTLAAGESADHTFNIAAGLRYNIVVTPQGSFNVAPRYSCQAGGVSASARFDFYPGGYPDSKSYTAPSDGSRTVTVTGYNGAAGSYTIEVKTDPAAGAATPTAVPPTQTATAAPATATMTVAPPTQTPAPLPPTETATAVPPTAAPPTQEPTATAAPQE
jgi:hypothetical protein